MKKLETFLYKCNLFLLWLIYLPLFTFVGYIMFYFINLSLGLKNNMLNEQCISMGILMSLIAIGLTWITRTASNFYDKSNEIEKNIEDATTKKELEIILEDLKKLSEKSFHKQTGFRVGELNIMLRTKYKYLP